MFYYFPCSKKEETTLLNLFTADFVNGIHWIRLEFHQTKEVSLYTYTHQSVVGCRLNGTRGCQGEDITVLSMAALTAAA